MFGSVAVTAHTIDDYLPVVGEKAIAELRTIAEPLGASAFSSYRPLEPAALAAASCRAKSPSSSTLASVELLEEMWHSLPPVSGRSAVAKSVLSHNRTRLLADTTADQTKAILGFLNGLERAARIGNAAHDRTASRHLVSHHLAATSSFSGRCSISLPPRPGAVNANQCSCHT